LPTPVGPIIKTPGDLGLADAGRPDHQDVLRGDFLAQAVGELFPAPAIAQGKGHGAFCIRLADDEAIQLGDDFAWGVFGHGFLQDRAGMS
jgi:hypothetical protein